MLHAAIQVVLYGLLAGFTALGFAATLAVMPSGRLKALGFGAGFVGAQILTCSLLVIFGVAVTEGSEKTHPDLRAALAIALALVLFVLALVAHRRPRIRMTAQPRTNARRSASTRYSNDSADFASSRLSLPDSCSGSVARSALYSPAWLQRRSSLRASATLTRERLSSCTSRSQPRSSGGR